MNSAKSWALHARLHTGQGNRVPRSASISRCSSLGCLVISSRWPTSFQGGVTPSPRVRTSLASMLLSPSLPPKGCHRTRAGQGQAAAQTRRWPATTLDRRCARRPVRWQVGTGGWPTTRSNKGMPVAWTIQLQVCASARPKLRQFHFQRRGGFNLVATRPFGFVLTIVPRSSRPTGTGSFSPYRDLRNPGLILGQSNVMMSCKSPCIAKPIWRYKSDHRGGRGTLLPRSVSI